MHLVNLSLCRLALLIFCGMSLSAQDLNEEYRRAKAHADETHNKIDGHAPKGTTSGSSGNSSASRHWSNNTNTRWSTPAPSRSNNNRSTTDTTPSRRVPIPLPANVHRKGDYIVADDGWKFVNDRPDDFSVVPVPDGTPSTRHPHWLWGGDGANLYTEPGWWPSKPGQLSEAIPRKPGMPVPGYEHIVFGDNGELVPEPGYEYVVSEYPGERNNFEVRRIVPQQFSHDSQIKYLIKQQHVLLKEKRELQRRLEQMKNRSPDDGDDFAARVSRMKADCDEYPVENAIKTKETELATIRIHMQDRVACLANGSCR